MFFSTAKKAFDKAIGDGFKIHRKFATFNNWLKNLGYYDLSPDDGEHPNECDIIDIIDLH